MNKSRAFRRDMRERKIRHRKKLAKSFLGYDWYLNKSISNSDLKPGELYSHYLDRINAGCDGKYSKGKIHCSCVLCTFSKKYKLPKKSELIDKEKVKEELKELENDNY